MPRPLKTDRPVRLEIQLPQSLYAKLRLELFSEIENRVPVGRTSELYTELTSMWLKSRGVL